MSQTFLLKITIHILQEAIAKLVVKFFFSVKE